MLKMLKEIVIFMRKILEHVEDNVKNCDVNGNGTNMETDWKHATWQVEWEKSWWSMGERVRNFWETWLSHNWSRHFFDHQRYQIMYLQDPATADLIDLFFEKSGA